MRTLLVNHLGGVLRLLPVLPVQEHHELVLDLLARVDGLDVVLPAAGRGAPLLRGRRLRVGWVASLGPLCPSRRRRRRRRRAAPGPLLAPRRLGRLVEDGLLPADGLEVLVQYIFGGFAIDQEKKKESVLAFLSLALSRSLSLQT